MQPQSPSDDVLLRCSFGTTKPEFVNLPNVVTRFSSTLVRLIIQLTKSKPGFWPLNPPFDEKEIDVHLEGAGMLSDNPFHLWTSVRNQSELINLADVGINVSGTLLLDAQIPEARLQSLLGDCFQNECDPLTQPMWSVVVSAINELKWVGVPFTADADWIIIIDSSSDASLVQEIAEWSVKNRISCSTIRQTGEIVAWEKLFDEGT